MLQNDKNIAVRSSQILYIFVLRVEKITTSEPKVLKLPHVIQNNIQNLETLHCYIFLILQHFATKLRNFTNFKIFFLTMMVDFVCFA